MKECRCGEEVTLQFARVFGTNDDEVLRCPGCLPDDESAIAHLQHGAAAREDYVRTT